MSNFGKNIRKIRNVKKLSQQAFAELFDLKRGTLGAYEEGRSEPKIETIVKIANHFSISIDDLLTSELTVNKLLKFKEDLALHGSFQKETFAQIPCITPSNEPEYIQRFDQAYFIGEMPQVQLPLPLDRTYRAYIVSNLEMTSIDKGLYPKDVVIGELISPALYHKAENGQLVLLLTEDKLYLRKFFHTGKTATLKASNKNIEDISIELTAIKEMWQIKFTFLKRVAENTSEIEEKLNYLEEEFKKIKQQL